MKLIGPSHCLRLKQYLDKNIIPNIFPDAKIIAHAGMPIWHGLISRELRDLSSKNFIVVGDFRFGNKIYNSEAERNNVSKSILGIDKNQICQAKDKELFLKSNQVLETLESDNNNIIFWDLYFREKQNINNGKYVDSENNYNHPIWNYKETTEKYTNAVDLDKYCNNEWNDFIIDKSNHPSLFGVFLLSCLYQDISYSHSSAKKVVSSNLAAIVSQCNTMLVVSSSLEKKITLLLNKYLRSFVGRLNICSYNNSVAEISHISDAQNVILVTDEVFDLHGKKLSHIKNEVNVLKDIFNGSVKIFLYNYSSNFVDSKRKKQKKHKYNLLNADTAYAITSIEVLLPEVIACANDYPDFLDSLFELRVTDPSFKFLVFILYSLAWPLNGIDKFIEFYDYFMCSIITNLELESY